MCVGIAGACDGNKQGCLDNGGKESSDPVDGNDVAWAWELQMRSGKRAAVRTRFRHHRRSMNWQD